MHFNRKFSLQEWMAYRSSRQEVLQKDVTRCRMQSVSRCQLQAFYSCGARWCTNIPRRPEKLLRTSIALPLSFSLSLAYCTNEGTVAREQLPLSYIRLIMQRMKKKAHAGYRKAKV